MQINKEGKPNIKVLPESTQTEWKSVQKLFFFERTGNQNMKLKQQ